MEPMYFFAHVTAEKADLIGPLQKPELTEKTLSARLGRSPEKIDIQMTRMGGGNGQRSYAHWLIAESEVAPTAWGKQHFLQFSLQWPMHFIKQRENDTTINHF